MTTAIEPQFVVAFPLAVPALSIADTEIRGTAEAMGVVLDFRSRALPALEQIVTNKGTNSLGKIEAWTTMAEAELPKLHSARAKVEANRAELATKLAQVEAAVRIAPTESPIERTDQWETGKWFAAQTPAKRQELVDALVRGEQQELRDRLLALPEYACPLSGPIRTLLYSEYIEAHADYAALTRLREQAEQVNTVARILTEHIEATEGGVDRERLRAKGLDIPKSRSGMTDKEKSDYIDQKGLVAFQKLPA